MGKTTILTLAPLAMGLCLAAPASAQDAAETAVILSGTSGQGEAARTLGDATRSSIRSATARVRAMPRRQARGASRRGGGRGRNRGRSAIYRIRDTGDALAYSDAKTYQTYGGARIRVSGGFTPSESTSCIKNCTLGGDTGQTPVE